MDFVFDQGLVLYLPLHELDGSSFASKDVSGQLATVTGALWRPSGRTFDGIDDEIGCGTTIGNGLTRITVEVWLKSTAGLGAKADGWYGGISKAGVFGLGWQGWTDGWTMDFYDTGSVRHAVDTTNVYLNAGQWYHLVYTYDGAFMKLYQDTVEITSANVGGFTFQTTANPLRVGYMDGGFWEGTIGEVKLYRRVLSAAEIQHNYLATKWRYQ